ncbi:MAG: cellulase family glycosylhydrolase [Puniceicoccaceae bacterium]
MKIHTKLFPKIAIAICSMITVMTFAAHAKQIRNPSGFIIDKGVNLSHWLSQDFGWAPREEWITSNDIHYIAHLGFDHVRLPIDEKELWDEEGNQNPEAFELMKTALGWCEREGLRVIIDLHTVRAHHFNAGEAKEGGNTLWTDPAEQEKFIDLWRQLSEHLRAYPVDFLAYEIMNEPTAEDPEDWNKLIAKSTEFIRSVEPERVLIFGGNMWQIPQFLPVLFVPENDENIILSFHTYEPLLFTHHTASWIDGPIQDYPGPVSYPGPIIDKETFDRLAQGTEHLRHPMEEKFTDNWGPERIQQEIQPAVDRARELGLQLYCGEFGCLPSVPREARLAYYRDLISVFRANDIAYANWEYKGDFGIFEWLGLPSLTGAPDVELIEILTGN